MLLNPQTLVFPQLWEKHFFNELVHAHQIFERSLGRRLRQSCTRSFGAAYAMYLFVKFAQLCQHALSGAFIQSHDDIARKRHALDKRVADKIAWTRSS